MKIRKGHKWRPTDFEPRLLRFLKISRVENKF